MKSEGQRRGLRGDHEWSPRRPSSTLAVKRRVASKAFALDKRVSRACQEQRLSPIDETLEDRFLPVHKRGSLRGTPRLLWTEENASSRVSARNTLLLKSEGRGGPPGRPRVVSRRPSSTLAVKRRVASKAFALDKRVSRACQEQRLSPIDETLEDRFLPVHKRGSLRGTPRLLWTEENASSRVSARNTLLLKSEGRGGPPGDHEWSPGGPPLLWPSRGGW